MHLGMGAVQAPLQYVRVIGEYCSVSDIAVDADSIWQLPEVPIETVTSS